MHSIEISGINKSYQKTTALKDINIEVREGELFGLIGPDGAGKTSLIRILTTLIKADSGTAMVNGKDVVRDYRSIRKEIGYMPGVFALYQDLTIQENLDFFASVFGSTIEENYELIAPIYEQIKPFKDRRAGKLSGGMKQKLALSCALIHRPDILFLDEPTTGVDAVSRQEFWDMLKDMKKHGITVFVSTPYMDEAILCDRVGLIQNGSMMDIDTPDKIVSNFSKKLIRIIAKDKYGLLLDLRKINFIDNAYPFGECTHVTLDRSSELDLAELEKILYDKGHKDVKLEWGVPDIEDRFIELMTKSQVIND